MQQIYFQPDYFCGRRGSMGQPHLHEHFEISFCVRGIKRVLINDDIWEPEGSCLMLFPENSIHRVLVNENSEYERYNIYFSRAYFCGQLSEYMNLLNIFDTKNLVSPVTPEGINNILQYFSPLINAEKEAGALLLALLMTEIRKISCCGLQSEKRNNSYIKEVLSYITENYNKKLLAEDVANRFFVSRAKLTADVKRQTGFTLNEYIITVRLKNAEILLRGGHSVLDSALKTGFVNQNHFIKSFEKYFRSTPLQYAKLNILR